MMNTSIAQLRYQPTFPANYHPGIGIIGCGSIVRQAHLPAYQKYGVHVVGVYDPLAAATEGLQAQYGIQKVYSSLDDLLGDPAVEVVDIATFPDVRIEIMRLALTAGKHILAQKPLALDLDQAREVISEADRLGLKVAVNQNGRWAPPWRIATLLVQAGAIGEVISITHLMDVNFERINGTRFDTVPHFLLYDYCIHWFDITHCWLDGKHIQSIRAREYRLPGQPAESQADWGMWSEIQCQDGTSAMLRCVGGSHSQQNGHYFWIHGTRGTVRGCVLPERFVELDNQDGITSIPFEGQWFPDGFAGTLGELLCAVEEDREPFNSARHNLQSLNICFSACQSAEQQGQPVLFPGF
jgi:predicted dehydrogenase